MQYQTFRGADVQEALLHVREALGADALIESTRHVRASQGALAGRTMVEIVAAPSAFPSRGHEAPPSARMLGVPSKPSQRSTSALC